MHCISLFLLLLGTLVVSTQSLSISSMMEGEGNRRRRRDDGSIVQRIGRHCWNSKNNANDVAPIGQTADSSPPPPLFVFDSVSGEEVSGLLPRVERRLDLGVDCYYEPQDAAVLDVQGRLARSSSSSTTSVVDLVVGAQDICWALEACKGDAMEATVRIKVAAHHRHHHHSCASSSSSINLDSYESVPLLEWTFKRELQKRRQEQKASSDGNGFGRLSFTVIPKWLTVGTMRVASQWKQQPRRHRHRTSRRDLMKNPSRQPSEKRRVLLAQLALFVGLCNFVFGTPPVSVPIA